LGIFISFFKDKKETKQRKNLGYRSRPTPAQGAAESGKRVALRLERSRFLYAAPYAYALRALSKGRFSFNVIERYGIMDEYGMLKDVAWLDK
jgi:hypothetical protein